MLEKPYSTNSVGKAGYPCMKKINPECIEDLHLKSENAREKQ